MQAIVIADNQEERDFLSFALRYAGLAVASSGELSRVVASLAERPVDLIVVSTANTSGLVRNVEGARSATSSPLMILLSDPTEELHCALLDAGADLILERPVSPRLLTRYAWTFLRRAADLPAFVLPALELGEFVLDPSSRTVALAGREPQHLTQLEFRLLYVLMTNRGQIIPSDVIVERVWGYTGEGNRELVRGLIRRLRLKIEPDCDNPRYILNVPGVGYRFSAE